MRLTQHSDFALRVLIHLGLQDDADAIATIPGIARAYGVSENHLVKVVASLAALGLVETQRGRGGGLRLVRAPAAVSVGAVMRAIEGPRPLVACFDVAAKGCAIAGPCRLQGALAGAREAFFAALDGVTLATLIAPRQALRERLGMPPRARPGAAADWEEPNEPASPVCYADAFEQIGIGADPARDGRQAMLRTTPRRRHRKR